MDNSIPKAAQEKIERAKKIEEELKKAQEIINNEPEEKEDAQPDDANSVDSQPEEPQSEATSEPEPKETQTSEEPEPDTETVKQEAESWRNRFVNYKKSTDQTIYQLRQENQAFTSTINILKEKISNLEEEAKKYNELKSQELSSKLSDELGEDSASIINEYVSKVVKPLQSENEILKKRLEAIEGTTAQNSNLTILQQVENVLRQQLPFYDQVNEDPDFVQYTKYTDPYSGRPIADLIRDAINTQNIRYLLDVYSDFYNLKYVQPQMQQNNAFQNQEQVNPVSDNSQQQTQKDEQQVQPSGAQPSEATNSQPETPNPINVRVQPEPSGTASNAEQGADKRIWTAADIKQFYIDKALNRLKPDVVKALELDIQRAYSEGRIIK